MPFALGVASRAPELARAPISEEVGAVHLGVLGTPVDTEADDAVALVHVAVFANGGLTHARGILDRIQVRLAAGIQGQGERMGAAHELPTIVYARLAMGLEVDLFVVILADVGDVHVAVLRVELKAPRIAQAIAPDLRLGVRVNLVEGLLGHTEELHLRGGRDERIVFRNGITAVRLGRVDIDAQDLRQPGAQVLACTQHIPFPTAVATTDVQVAIGAEGDFAAVVIGIGARHLEHHPGGLGIGLVGVGFGDLILNDEPRAVKPHVGVMDVEFAVFGEFRMKLEVVEPLFEEGADHRLMDVEEGLVLNFAVLDESDDAGSLADKQAVVVAWG